MPRFFLRILVGFVTFVVGIAVTYVSDKSWTVPNDTVIIVKPVYKSEAGIVRFSPSARGCGAGYSQLYVTDDDQPVSEGVHWDPSTKIIRRNFRKLVRDAKNVVERSANFRGYPDRVGERIIIVNQPGKLGEDSVSILFYDGGDSYRFINAPTLALALEFEQYLISIDFKSPM